MGAMVTLAADNSSTLTGKTVIVTGAASGIGAATAMLFATHGVKVVIADMDSVGGHNVATAIEENGGQSLFVQTDVRSPDQAAAMVDATVARFGRVDFAFNNAGINGVATPLHETPEEEWHEVVNINLTGVWLCMKYELRQMVRQGYGAIVNASSAAGLVGRSSGIGAYVASKHGVVGLTRAAALEYAGSIRVNAVCPGVVRTNMLESIIREGRIKSEDDAAELQAMRRVADPKEIAEAVVWLCSDAASFITGHALAVDGGWTAR